MHLFVLKPQDDAVPPSAAAKENLEEARLSFHDFMISPVEKKEPALQQIEIKKSIQTTISRNLG